MHDGERAKHTPGYLITCGGRVYSTDHNWRGYGNREMQWTLNSDGYPSVRLTINGKRSRLAVHRLVALHYLPEKPAPDHEVRHLDGNKMNPFAGNLAWGTRKENADDRERHGRTSRGKKHSVAILNSSHAQAVAAFHSNKSRAAIAKATGADA